MKQILSFIAATETSFFTTGIIILVAGIILGSAMLHDYSCYLEEHRKKNYSFADFLSRGRLYIYLFLGFSIVIVEAYVIFMLANT